jgi:hypothetical protein
MSDSENEEVQIQTLKKPKTAYIHFCNVKRPEVKDKNSNLSPKEILSKLGELWQELKNDGGNEYKKYLTMAEEDKVRYQREKEENPDIKEKPRKKRESKKTDDDKKKTDDDKKKEKNVKPKKEKKTKENKSKEDNGEEKKPRKLNGYLKFLQANRDGFKAENPEFNSKQITSELATKWRELTDEDKQHWKNS